MLNRRSLLLILGICVFTLVFFVLNIPNIKSVYKLAIVDMFDSKGRLPQSPVTRINIQNNSYSQTQSFIRNSITTQTGKSVYFIHIPSSLDLSTSRLLINDTQVANPLASTFENDTLRIYFIPQDQPQLMIKHITSESLQIRQPPQP